MTESLYVFKYNGIKRMNSKALITQLPRAQTQQHDVYIYALSRTPF